MYIYDQESGQVGKKVEICSQRGVSIYFLILFKKFLI